jgi:site-specific DNA-adenine methylase
MENAIENLMDVVDKLIEKYEMTADDVTALEEAIYALDVSSSYDEEADEEADEEENYSDFE